MARDRLRADKTAGATGEALFRAAFEQASIGRTVSWVDGGFERVNQRFCAMVGYSAVELEAMTFAEITHPADLEASGEAVRCLVAGEQETLTLEKRYVHRDGRTIWTEVNTTLLRDRDGQPLHFITDIVDISARKQAEQALRDSELRYRLLFENILNGCALHEVVVNKEGEPVDYVFLEVNAAFERLTGLRRSDIVGKKVTGALPGTEDDPADWIGRYGRVALTGQEIRFEQYSRAIGRWFSVLAFQPSTGQFATVFEDITERKDAEEARDRLEDQLRQAQKMEAVGRLAGGVAHDFNNMLTVINSYAEMAVADLRDENPLRSDILQILEAGRRAIMLTRQLLAFSRKQVLAPKVLDLNEVVLNLHKMLKPGIDGLSPENVLIFGTGLLTGSGVPNSGRFNVTAKSPESKVLGDSNCGGFFGPNHIHTGRCVRYWAAGRQCRFHLGRGRLVLCGGQKQTDRRSGPAGQAGRPNRLHRLDRRGCWPER